MTAWGTSAKAVWVPGADHGPLEGRTLRLLARVQTDGDGVRIRLSNRYGYDALEIGSMTVGVAPQDPAPSAGLVDGQAAAVTFGEQPATSIPAYSDVVSDPVTLPVTHGTLVAVSLFLPRMPSVTISEHQTALQTSFLSVPGNHTADGDGGAFTKQLTSWPVLTGIDVHTTRPTNSVLVLGDSITDGLGTAQDRDQRWTDALVAHLAPSGQVPQTTVVNGGMSGNELLSDAPDETGDSPLRRLSWELPAGAGDVILEIGNNDIKQGRSTQQIIDGLTRFAGAAKARGVRVLPPRSLPRTRGWPGTDPGGDSDPGRGERLGAVAGQPRRRRGHRPRASRRGTGRSRPVGAAVQRGWNPTSRRQVRSHGRRRHPTVLARPTCQ